ncbi:MAG: BMP family ABC transporter substrate-binding protein [Clostridia bacterium]|nr:BMP family ABC transporter substrate-binding protein [Clostridia bacterium]
MAELHYKDALKLGQKEYRACVSAGKDPCLPVLDDIVPSERSAMGLNLGLVSIPAELIIGTKTRGRTNAFARNFMPLLAENTEFAQKWERLCQSHLEEGIRDPIKVYEYLNRYYVQEGNKRVSVLRFFGAVSIPAQVIRIMPKDTGAEEVKPYLEYLAFNRLSGVNYVEFHKKGSYARLQAFMGKGADEPWDDEDRSRFSAAYHAFKQAYEGVGGGKLATSAADAVLAYLEIYGYENLCAGRPAELKKAIARMWEEVELKQEDSPIELKTEPSKEKKAALLSKVVSTVKPVKVAFIYDKNPRNSAWAYGHEQGRRHVQEAFQGRLETTDYCDAIVNGEAQTLEKAIAEGNRVLFTTSPRLLPASLQAAVAHPEATIFNCALNQSHRYIRTYYPRAYEVKFIIGAIAGAMAAGEDIGYVCDYPIYGQVAGINAFALGVQLVNPRAKVVLEWSSVDGARAARQKLEGKGIRLISAQDFARSRDGSFEANGLTLSEDDGVKLLAAPLWKWDVYYEEMLRRLLDRTMKEEYAASNKALNYYWGMAADVMDVRWSEALPDGVRKLAGMLKQGICRESCDPFLLPIRDQSGRAVAAGGDALGLEQIMGMDWLVDNVVGALPSYDELKSFSKVTVDVMGVVPSTKNKS